MFEWLHVPTLGGGLNLSAHPAFIRDDQWSWVDGWWPRDGVAEVMPGWITVPLNSAYVPTNNVVQGIYPDVFNGGVLIVTVHTGTEVVRLFNIPLSGVVAEKAVSGTAPTGRAAQAAYGEGVATVLVGKQLLAFGQSSASNYGAAYYDGTNFFRIAPSAVFQPDFFAAVGGYALAGRFDQDLPDSVGVRVSDANDPTVWDPDISNNADEFTLESAGDLRAFREMPNGVLCITSRRAFRLSPTGASPPIHVELLHDVGISNARLNDIVASPQGLFYVLDSDVYLNGAPLPHLVTSKLMRPGVVTGSSGGPLQWHPILNALIVGADDGRYLYDPAAQAWTRQAWPTDTIFRGAISFRSANLPGHWIRDLVGNIYVDGLPGVSTAQSSAVLCTKWFSFDGPSSQDYIDRVTIDWEPLTNATTDAVEVLGYFPNDLSNGVLGASTMELLRTGQLTSLGTLTGGQSELPINRKGKYSLFALRQSSGSVRVRGIHIRHERANDRKV